MGGALVGSSQAPQGIRRKVGRSFRGFAGARFHRQLAQWCGMVEQLIEGFSRVESGTSSALMNRVIGARWSPQSLAPRGEKPNHWLPPLTSIKATIPASRQASAWSTQIQLVSHWQLPHVGPTCSLGSYICVTTDCSKWYARPGRCPECAGKMGKCMVGCMALNKSTKM